MIKRPDHLSGKAESQVMRTFFFPKDLDEKLKAFSLTRGLLMAQVVKVFVARGLLSNLMVEIKNLNKEKRRQLKENGKLEFFFEKKVLEFIYMYKYLKNIVISKGFGIRKLY